VSFLGPPSDGDDVDSPGVGCQGFEVCWVSRDHGSPRFSRRYYERIDGRTAAGASPQEGGSTRKRLGDGRTNVTCLQELVLNGVATSVSLEALNENDRRNARGPQSGFAKGQNKGERLFGSLGEAGDAA
jgi:hypothetical protein